MNNKFVGTGVALVTPFNKDLSVNHNALAQIVEHNIQNGTDYLVISGTTGESVTITKDEKKTDHFNHIPGKSRQITISIGNRW